jgi:primosomal protein N'
VRARLGDAEPRDAGQRRARQVPPDRLPDRVDERPLPACASWTCAAKATGIAALAAAARALGERLERGEQALLFLNRRGHSHHTQCRACGFVPSVRTATSR